MKTFLRALYVIAIEALIWPLQLIALIGYFIYAFVDNYFRDEFSFAESIEIASCVWIGAWLGIKVMGNYIKTGELDLDVEEAIEEYL